MSDYKPVKDALAAGTPPELVCAACPWDRLCITPPSMTSGDIAEQMAKAKAQDAKRANDDSAGDNMPIGTLMTVMMLAGRDTAAQLCPVFALKLRGPEGREVADTLRLSMRGER